MFRCDSSTDTDEFDVDFGDAKPEHDYKNVLTGKSDRNTPNIEQFKIAIKRNDIEFVKNILSEGFDVNRILTGGWTPLMYASDNGCSEIVTLLLESGADPKTEIDTFSALMAVCSSSCDSEERLVLCAGLLLLHGAMVNRHDRHHMTSLMYACQRNRSMLVQLLLKYGADVNHQDLQGWSAVTYAANNGNEAIVRLLLDAGSDPTTENSNGEKAAMLSRGSYAVEDTVSVDSHQYGELDVFIQGLQLEEHLPLFKKHHVDFAVVLTMNDSDLRQIGIFEVSARRKILNAIASVHKKQWDMPDQDYLARTVLSSSEVVITMSHLQKHIQYLKTTSDILVSSLTKRHDWRMENFKKQELLNEVNKLEDSVDGLHRCILQIKCDAMDMSKNSCNTSHKMTSMHAAGLFGVCAVMCCGLLFLFKSTSS